MVCTNRQLQQADRTAAFSSNAAVIKQLRALPNHATPEQVKGWLQHELHPAVQHVRSRLNEAYPHYARNAPSGNPLYYLFKEDTAASDPQFGFIKFDQAVQNTSATIRVSEKNAKLQSIIPWLTIMQGSGTSPLGVLTLADTKDPTRFIRFNLNSMVDQGTYWDLGVTPVESSTASPFVGGGETFVSFIAGVASGGVTLASTVPAIRGISAGTQLLTSGTLLISNINGLTFGLSNSSVLTASMDAFRSISLQTFAGSITQSMQQATDVTMTGASLRLQSAAQSDISNANVEWRIRGNTLLGVARPMFMAGGAQASVPGISFKDSNGISWGLTSGSNATAPSFGLMALMTASVNQDLGLFSHVGGNAVSSATRLAFSNASGVTWSLSTAASAATVLASVNDQSVAVVSHVGGNVVSSLTRLAFSNASNVTWSLSTAAGAATVLASVAAQSAQTFIGGLAAGTQTATSGTIVFSNSNDMSFGMSGSTQVTASYQQQFGLVSHIGGNVVSSVRSLAFSNASNVTWSLSTAANAATVIASVAAGGGGGSIIGTVSHIGGNSQSNVSQLIFSNAASNVSFILNTAAGAVTVQARAFDAVNTVSAGTQVAAVTQLAFADSNGVSFGLSGSSRITASYLPQIGLLSHIGGNQVSSVTRLAFSNASNVTWSLSTAANAATVLASVAAAAGGVALAAGTQTATSGTVVFTQGTNVTAGAALASVNNVVFEMTNSSQIQATALMRVTANVTTTGGFQVSKINFKDAGGIQWGVATSNDAEGRGVEVTARLADLSYWNNFQGGGLPLNVDQNSSVTAHSNLHVFPLANYGNHAFPGNMTLATLGIMGNAASTTTNSPAFTHTYRIGLYTLANSTQLSLLNSVSFTLGSASRSSATWNASAQGNRYITVHSSQWSSQPVLSAGIQYWCAMQRTNNAASASLGIFQLFASYNQGVDFRGHFGSSVAISVRNPVPFGGMVNTTNIPTTIGATQFASGTNTSSGIGGQNFIYVVSYPPLAAWNGLRSNFP